MRLVAYRRRRVGDAINGDRQLEVVRAWAARTGHLIVAEVFDTSDGSSRYRSDGVARATALVEAGEADGVVVYEYSHLASGISRFAETLNRLYEVGGHLYSATQSVDPEVAGVLSRALLSAVAAMGED